MNKISKSAIQLIGINSKWSKKGIDQALKNNVYHNRLSWIKFLRLFLVSAGAGFTLAGIIFFFAYNWASLHKFAKLGIIEGLLIAVILTACFAKISILLRNILLTGAAILVGVLMAVFGQVYQTGANAYDFFLGWTLLITVWVLVSGFEPMWLLWIILINTTTILYYQQVVSRWDTSQLNLVLFLINGVTLLAAETIPRLRPKMTIPIWFSYTIATGVAVVATLGISQGISESYNHWLLPLILLTGILYIAGFIHGINRRKGYYLAIIPLSIMLMITSLLLRESFTSEMLLLVTTFILASVTGITYFIIQCKKQWKNEP